MAESSDLTCRTAVALLPEYLDDELPEARAVLLEQHIVVCRGCHEFLAQLRQTIAAVSGLRRDSLRRRLWLGITGQLEADDGPGEPAGEAGHAVTAYKFLDHGRISPLARVRWPEPGGGWVAAADSVGACRRAVHACRVQDLAYWLGQRLWRVELAGGVTRTATKIVAERGRLIEPVDGWPAAGEAFIKDCTARLAELLDGARGGSEPRAIRALDRYAEEVRDDRDPISVAYTVAHAAGIVGWLPGEGLTTRARAATSPFDAERRRQARWLARRLDLAD